MSGILRAVRGDTMSNRATYRKIAKKYGVSPKEVKADMQECLNHMWSRADKTPEMEAAQQKISAGGKAPTTDEFLNYFRKARQEDAAVDLSVIRNTGTRG